MARIACIESLRRLVAQMSLSRWEKELRGNENRSTAQSALGLGTEDQFPQASRRSRSGVGRMARLAPQRARKLAKSAQSHEPIDSLETARDVTAIVYSVKCELGASLRTNTVVCAVGGTVPTTPMIGKDLLTDIPFPPVSSHGSHQRRRR